MKRLAELKTLRKVGQRAASSGPQRPAKGKGKAKDGGRGTNVEAGKDAVPHESKKMDDASVKSVAPGPSEEAGGKAAKEGAPEEPLTLSKPFPFPPKPPAKGSKESPGSQPPTFPGRGPEDFVKKPEPADSGKGKQNSWQLSQSFPVDMRLLVAALAMGGGGLTYWWFGKENELNHALPGARQDAAHSAYEKMPESGDRTTSQQDQGGVGEPGSSSAVTQSDFYSDELGMQAGNGATESLAKAAGSGSEGGAGMETGSAEAAAGQDSSIPGLSASEAEGHARAVADVLNSVLASQIQVVDAEKEEEELKHASAHSSDADPGGDQQGPDQGVQAHIADADERRRQSEQKLQETLSVLKENVADTSGETLWSSASSQVGGPQQQGTDKSPASAASGGATDLSEDQVPDEALGIQEDLRPAALIRRAIDRGEGSGSNWDEFQQRLKQAQSDALTFKVAKQQAWAAKQEEVSGLQREVQGRDQLLQAAEQKMADELATFKSALNKQKQLLLDQKQEELEKQKGHLSSAFAEASLRERTARLEVLDQVRMKLNSLTQAFSQRSEESAASHSVHKLTLGVFALNNALEAGHPTSRHRDLLRSSCDKDPLVSLAVDSLPESTDSQGVATRPQLLQKWPDVRRMSGQLAYLQPGQTGYVQLGLASLASRFKVIEVADEQQPQAAAQSVDQWLAHAEAEIVRGKYTEAARCLEKGLSGTAAEVAIRSWTEKLRARAIADQAVKLLQAHASAQVASIS